METDYITAYVGLGSNLGDRAGNLLLALRGLLEASFSVHKVSAVYETEAIGLENAPKFLNMVAEIRVTNISASQMMARLLRIEYLLGRRDKTLKKPRTVDLDILLFGDELIDTEFVTVPHPRMHLRRFVLVPLNEIAPNLIHPILQTEIHELLENVDDNSYVARWDPNAGHEELAAINS